MENFDCGTNGAQKTGTNALTRCYIAPVNTGATLAFVVCDTRIWLFAWRLLLKARPAATQAPPTASPLSPFLKRYHSVQSIVLTKHSKSTVGCGEKLLVYIKKVSRYVINDLSL